MRQRWWYLSGVGFAVALVVGFMMSAGTYPEDSKAPDADWIKVMSSSGARAKIIVGAYVLFAAALLFMWFAAAIRTALQGDDSSPSVLTRVASGSAIVFASLLLVGALAIASVPASIAFGDAAVPGADFARQLTQLGMGAILAPGALAAAVFIAATSRVAAAAGLLPRGVAALGYVAAVMLLFGAFFLPFLALPIWAIVVGIALSRHSVAATPPRTRPGVPASTPSAV